MKPAERFYTTAEIQALLAKAQRLGFDLSKGSWVEQMSIAQLEYHVSMIGEA